MSQFIKITFHQIVTEIKWHQKWQFDKTWFYKLLCDSLLNSLVQFWVLRLPIGQEIGTGVPPGKSLIVTPTIWRSIPTVHMNRQTLTGPEKYPPPPIFKYIDKENHNANILVCNMPYLSLNFVKICGIF